MNRILIVLTLGAVLCVSGIAHAAVGDSVYWVGGSAEWTGDFDASPAYSTGHWSATADGSSGLLPALKALGQTNGMRVNDVNLGAGGVQIGTEIKITTGATVTYNGNNQIVPPNPSPSRFGDWRVNTNALFPTAGSLTISNGSALQMTTDDGTDDGNWTRWNGTTLTLDNGTFRRTADHTAGSTGGAFMLASFHGFDNSVQTISLTNGGRIENDGQLWWGQSTDHAQDHSNHKGIKVTMTIDDGSLDLTGGNAFELDNDGLPLKADMAFIYDVWTGADKESYIINFTGPGSITVDAAGIRVATAVDSGIVDPGGTGSHLGHTFTDYGTDGTTQRSYEDLWNMGILQANGLSGAAVAGDYNGDGTVDAADYVMWRNGDSPDDTQAGYDLWAANFGEAGGAVFSDYFSTSGSPGSDNYTLTSLIAGSGSGSSLAAVPEPGAMVLMIVGLASLLASKRRVG